MITFTILLAALLVVMITIVLSILVGGAGVILTCGDAIVCVLIIMVIVKLIRKNKK